MGKTNLWGDHMIRWFKQLDEILRGDATKQNRLREGRLDIPVGGLFVTIVVLAAFYGLCMGVYRMIGTGAGPEGWRQLVASAVKLPLLFILTLIVTFPSLYVFNAIVGSRLTVMSVARLLTAMLGVMLAVLASLGPIVAFFAVSTESYPFMKLLNVIMATIAGGLGLAFLLRTLHGMVTLDDVAQQPAPPPPPPPPPAPPAPVAQPAAGETATPYAAPPPRRVPPPSPSSPSFRAKAVFYIWVIVFALVGSQMSWVLRPFIGNPDEPFQWLRQRQSNFFLDFFKSLGQLLG